MSLRWKIEYWVEPSKKNSIKEWFENLPKEHVISITDEIEKLEIYGNNLKMPSSKALGKGLFELRERTYHYRIYYTFNGKQIIIFLIAGNKKTQEKDIKIARKRLQEL